MKVILNKVLLLGLFFVLVSCNKNDEDKECPDNLVCTLDFRSIHADINWISNDCCRWSYSTSTLKRTGEVIFTSMHQDNYTQLIVLTDLDKTKLNKSGDDIEVKIYNDKGVIVQEVNYKIGHDCCHIVKISGPEVITIP